MGMCNPHDVRKGEPWYLQVNKPGFSKGKIVGSPAIPMAFRNTKPLATERKEIVVNGRETGSPTSAV